MKKAIVLFRQELRNEVPAMYERIEDFHVSCVAHVLNLAVQNCVDFIQDKIEKVPHFISAIRFSVKRRGAFNDARIQMRMKTTLPNLDVIPRWLFTFNIL